MEGKKDFTLKDLLVLLTCVKHPLSMKDISSKMTIFFNNYQNTYYNLLNTAMRLGFVLREGYNNLIV